MTNYHAHTPDASGFIQYSDDEHAIWHDLFIRQELSIIGKACKDYLDGLDKLALPTTQIPQLADIDQVLQQTTGFATAAVPALISFSKFLRSG